MSRDRLFVFLRAVNLGRVNKVPMRELMTRIESAKLGECSYLLQSGNLIFGQPAEDPTRLKRALERLIDESFAVSTVAISRTAAELEELLGANPFEVPDGGSIHVAMWDEQPNESGLEELTSSDFGEDRLFLAQRAAIISFAGGSRNSRLSNALIERRLKVPATARNIRTIERLLAG